MVNKEKNLTAQENLTSESNINGIKVVDYLTGNGFPAEIPPKIKNSPNGAFYYDALRAGWSVRQLQRYDKEM